LARGLGGKPSLEQQRARKEELRSKCETAMDAVVDRLRKEAAADPAGTGEVMKAPEGSLELKDRVTKAVDIMQR